MVNLNIMVVYPNAKINIGLYVTERRPDGYHNLETVFFPIQLADQISITPNGSEQCCFRMEGLSIDGSPEDNLILKTFRLFQERFHIGGVDIDFQKTIPMGAGLGGGSSDAAFTAKELNRIFALGQTSQQLRQLIKPLGADCPFFIDNTPSYAEGIGDLLSPIELSLEGYYLLLVKPDIHVSTAEAYRNISPKASNVDLRSYLAHTPVEHWKEQVRNDFEASVFPAHPELAHIKQKLYEQGAVYAAMSGSGSTLFGLFAKMPDVTPFHSHFSFLQSC